MACETFLKIVSKCKRKFVVMQVRGGPAQGSLGRRRRRIVGVDAARRWYCGACGAPLAPPPRAGGTRRRPPALPLTPASPSDAP